MRGGPPKPLAYPLELSLKPASTSLGLHGAFGVSVLKEADHIEKGNC
jgi:hypothetical protein